DRRTGLRHGADRRNRRKSRRHGRCDEHDGRPAVDDRDRDLTKGARSMRAPSKPFYFEARNLRGSTGVEPLRISKCNCGEVTLPVWPERAITCPRLTVSPRLTSNSLALA